MESIQLQLVDAFTTVPYSGNPAGVVLEAANLSDGQMQSIAREVRASETAFVCGGEFPGPFRVRFFTPAEEVPLCGHATVATFHSLIWAGSIPLRQNEVIIEQETEAGLLPLRLLSREGVVDKVMMGQKEPVYEQVEGDIRRLSESLGLAAESIERGSDGVGPPLIVSTGLRCLHVALPDLNSVRDARPDFRAIAGLSRELDITTIQILTLDTESKETYAHVRTFAPAVGVDEDPVTGTAAGSLGGYLAYAGRLPEGDAGRSFLIEQGSEVGRPGLVEVELELRGESVTEVWVGGNAVVAFEGEMRHPAA